MDLPTVSLQMEEAGIAIILDLKILEVSIPEMMMIEGSADQMPEDRFVAALEYAHEAIQDIIAAQRQLAELCAKEKKEFDLCNAPDEVLALCREITGTRMDEAIFAPSRQERQEAVNVVKEEASTACEEKFGEDFDPDHVKMAFEVIQEEVYRDNILQKGKRADGRAPADLREVTCETGLLPAFTDPLFSPEAKHRLSSSPRSAPVETFRT